MARKFNSGVGAVICDFCRIIIKDGDDTNDSRVVKLEFDEFDKKNYLHACLNCYRTGKCTRDTSIPQYKLFGMQ